MTTTYTITEDQLLTIFNRTDKLVGLMNLGQQLEKDFDSDGIFKQGFLAAMLAIRLVNMK